MCVSLKVCNAATIPVCVNVHLLPRQDVSAGTYPEHAHGAVPTYTGCAPFQSYSSLEPPLEKPGSAGVDDVTAVTSHPMFVGGNGHQYFVVEQDNVDMDHVNCRN